MGVFITSSIATYVLLGRVNDTFGHAFGDEVIKCVSTIFEKNCPADAICARYGGEEFALILPAPPCFLKRLIKPCMRQNEAGKTA